MELRRGSTGAVIGLGLVLGVSLTLFAPLAQAGLWDRLKEATEGVLGKDSDTAPTPEEQEATPGEREGTPTSAIGAEGCADTTAPAVGDWVEYRMLTQDNPETQLRRAVVGREEREGQTMDWVETVITQQGKADERTIIKVLMPGYPYRPGEMQDMIMKSGNEQAMRMGPMMMMVRGIAGNMMKNNPGMSAVAECQAMTYVGEESVSVPAGSFDARHYRDDNSGAELWTAQDLVFSIVKYTDGDGATMELTGHGQGAKSEIDEEPQDPFQ
jgi:hypothetical protein